MKYLLMTEEILLFLLGIWAFYNTNYSWWWFLILILSPDLSMVGYAFNNKFGAFLYNLFHHKGIAVIVFFIGLFFKLDWLELAGIILFTHSCMDRILGYGLKYNKGFAYTHLGIIGKNKT